MRLGSLVTLVVVVVLAACDARRDDRAAELQSVMATADNVAIRTREPLSSGKYVTMASSLFDFYRGSIAVYRHDVRAGTTPYAQSRFAMAVPLVPSLGDPHPENFGILRAGDGTIAIEPNDFDAADDAPYLWDVRRLTTGCVLAAMVSNAEDPVARDAALAARRAIARAAAQGYRDRIEASAEGQPTFRLDTTENPILADLFSRSERDVGTELEALTVLDGTTRRLVRGAFDEEDPQKVLADLPASVVTTLPQALERYRRSVLVPPAPGTLQVLDAVRQFGSGVASWARIRILVLVRGATDAPEDDVILQVKEDGDSLIAGLYPPGLSADSIPDRLLHTARTAWARGDADAWWGAMEWLGLPFVVTRESEGEKGLNTGRLVEKRGTVAALTDLATILGGLVARTHARSRVEGQGFANAKAIARVIARDREGFLDEQADLAVAYADQVVADHATFLRLLREQGLRLGVPFDAADLPKPDFARLLGTPPPLAPLP